MRAEHTCKPEGWKVVHRSMHNGNFKMVSEACGQKSVQKILDAL